MKRILVIDDNGPVGEMVVRYLSRFGCEVGLALSPVGVLSMVREYRPDVVMLGFGMSPCSRDTVARLLHDHREMLDPIEVVLFAPGNEMVCEDTGHRPPSDGLITYNGSVEELEEVLERCVHSSGKGFL